MTQPEAIVFDLDGTLIHSVPDMHVSLNRMLSAFDRPPLSLDKVTSFVGNGVEKLVERGLKATGDCDAALKRKAVEVFLNDYSAQKTKLTRPYPGVVACLSALHAQGTPLAICTNKPHAAAVEICDTLDMSRWLSVIQGAVPETAKKPDPALLIGVLDKLGSRVARTLYVGDSLVDFETARNAKVPFRLFTKGYWNAPAPDLQQSQLFDDWSSVRFAL